MIDRGSPLRKCFVILVVVSLALGASAQDSDRDGLPDAEDDCPFVVYEPGFDWGDCDPMNLDPDDDAAPECRARERVAHLMLNGGVYCSHMAFAVVRAGAVHFADAFAYIGGGQYVHDPAGVDRLFRVGSTTKALTATAATVLAEAGELSFDDWVDDEDGSQVLVDGERTLRQLLSHQGAFLLDTGALHLFCYPGDLTAFWAEPDDLISPHYNNLGGGFAYSAFNFSLAGAYLTHRTDESFAQILQTRVFDPAGMCTATLDAGRAVTTPIGDIDAVSQAAVMHVGPYINQVSPTDPGCEDNYYSSDALPGDPYTWLYYRLDEAGAEARDPAGGAMASVVDMAHFARALLASYEAPGGLISPQGVRELWGATSDLGCHPDCPYERYYGIGFFTDSQPGGPVTQVGHGGSRAGYASALVLRPEVGLAVSILADADVSTVALSDLAKAILDDFETVVGVATPARTPYLAPIGPNPLTAGRGAADIRFSLPRDARVQLQVFDVAGRLVGTLADETFAAGDHGVVWDPTGRDLAAGVYFVRFRANGLQDVRKVVVFR